MAINLALTAASIISGILSQRKEQQRSQQLDNLWFDIRLATDLNKPELWDMAQKRYNQLFPNQKLDLYQMWSGLAPPT